LKGSVAVMKKATLWEQVRETEIPADETVLTQVIAMKRPPFLLSVLFGAFSGILIKNYVITLTEKNIYFTSLGTLTNKPDVTDRFSHQEVIKFQAKKGFLQHTLHFRFANGNTLKLKAIFRKKPKEGLLNPESLQQFQSYILGS
jgi:hypothetical protein